MIQGQVDEQGLPVIPVEIDGTEWRGVIDTGFNGDLELPQSLRDSLKAQFAGRVLSLLAAGRSVVEDSCQVMVPFDGEMIEAFATFVPGTEILIGTQFLRGHRLLIDFSA